MDFAVIADAVTPATGSGALDILLPFINFGLIAVLLIMAVKKVGFVPKWTLDDLKEAHERELKVKDQVIAGKDADLRELKEANSALQMLTREQVIPALVRSNQLSADYVQQLAERSNTGRGRRRDEGS